MHVYRKEPEMATTSATQIAIEKVLTEAGHPMRSKDIKDKIMAMRGNKLAPVTVTTTLAVQAKKGGLVKRNAGGLYVLNTKRNDAKADKSAAAAKPKSGRKAATDKTPTATSGPKAIKDVSEIDAALTSETVETVEVNPDPKPGSKAA